MASPKQQTLGAIASITAIAVGAAVLVLFVVLMGTVLSNIFGDVDDGLGGDELGLNSPTESSEQTSEPQAAGQVQRAACRPIHK